MSLLSLKFQKRELELAIEPDDADDSYVDHFNGLNMEEVVTPTPGGPFSALTPSMWPQEIMAKQSREQDDPNSQPEYRQLQLQSFHFEKTHNVILGLMNSDFESKKRMVPSRTQTSFLAFRLLKIPNTGRQQLGPRCMQKMREIAFCLLSPLRFVVLNVQ